MTPTDAAREGPRAAVAAEREACARLFRGLIEVHWLIVTGRGDSPAADGAAGRLEEHWKAGRTELMKEASRWLDALVGAEREACALLAGAGDTAQQAADRIRRRGKVLSE